MKSFLKFKFLFSTSVKSLIFLHSVKISFNLSTIFLFYHISSTLNTSANPYTFLKFLPAMSSMYFILSFSFTTEKLDTLKNLEFELLRPPSYRYLFLNPFFS